MTSTGSLLFVNAGGVMVYMEWPTGKYGNSCGFTGEYVLLAEIVRVLKQRGSCYHILLPFCFLGVL